jgi:hypothetical protein
VAFPQACPTFEVRSPRSSSSVPGLTADQHLYPF